MKEKIVKRLNSDFNEGDEPHIVTPTDMYIRVMCKYKGCNFQIWYQSTKKGGCKYIKSVNQNHWFQSHIQGQLCDYNKII